MLFVEQIIDVAYRLLRPVQIDMSCKEPGKRNLISFCLHFELVEFYTCGVPGRGVT